MVEILKSFEFTSVSGRIHPPILTVNPLGPLSLLPGIWKGTGFNQIWRPFHAVAGSPPGQDRFLELNETLETLQFDTIPGNIPNRGLLQADINLHGLHYLQQVQDANVLGPNKEPAGIHIEPGIWVTVPATAAPQDPTTVARLANIPHGTSLVAQGVAVHSTQGPTFNQSSITPFAINQPAQTHVFPEVSDVNSAFRTPAADVPGLSNAIVSNPNLFLSKGVAGKNIISMTTLVISTRPLNPPSSGGGASNIAFLDGAANGPNARAAQMDATFWIETIREPDGSTKFQLQYTQTVLLNFNGLSWPHVSVATLMKQ